jgi:hypothetical protein
VKDYHKVNTNWDIEIPGSTLNKFHGRGSFSLLPDNELVLAYNKENEDNFHKKGILARIKQSKIEEIFETEYHLWAPVLDYEDIYSVSAGVVHAGVAEKGRVFKIRSDNSLDWQYQLDGEATSLPVIWRDYVYIIDYVRSKKSGYIYKFDKKGNLILKTQIHFVNHFEPWILQDRDQIIVSYNQPPTLLSLDFEGNLKSEKRVSRLGTILFSKNDNGDIFATINNSIIALDDNLDTLWEYKPVKGFPNIAPIIDSEGNLYSVLSNQNLVSLDRHGKERWVTQIYGQGYQPCILDDDNILTATSFHSNRKSEEEQYITHVEIFSKDGNKILDYELPGNIFHVATNNNLIFVATNCRRINVEQEQDINSIKVFSLTLD